MKNLFVLILALLLSSCAHFSEAKEKKLMSEQAIKKALALYDMGEVEASISSLQLFVDAHPYDPSLDKAYELIVTWLLELKRGKEAKRIASHFLADHPESMGAERLIKLFDHVLEAEEPKNQVINQEPSLPKSEELEIDDAVFESKKESLLKTAEYYFHLGDFKKCREVIGPNPKDEALKALKHEMDLSSMVDKKAVGILLPLSGPYQAFAKKTLNAMGMALKTNLVHNGQEITAIDLLDMKIFIADTKGEPLRAALMARSLIGEHKVSMMIGEITNDASLAIAQICEQYSVPLLTLSRHPSLTSLGKNIFVFNSSSQAQVEFLVDQALKEGHKKFAILFPKHNYGMSMSKLFFDEVIKRGADVTALEDYEAHETMFFDPVKKLVGTFYQPTPVIDFDAIYVPEFQKLAFLVPALIQEDILVSNNKSHVRAYSLSTKKENPKPIQLLGTDSWNDQGLLNKLANKIDGAYFVDSISFATSDELKSFAEHFLSQNGVFPQALDAFAHDAAGLARHVIKDLGDDNVRSVLQQKIAKFNGKIGLLNKVSFLPSGELDAPKIGFNIVNGQAIINSKVNG